jgi:hypothetical protein
MATTYRQVLNNILVGLREDQIDSGTSTLTDEYHLLLGLFVNQIKEIVEDQHNWRALRESEDVSVTSGSDYGTFSNANERSRVLRVQDELVGEERALVFDITDSTNPYRLHELDMAELIRKRELDTTGGGDPEYFAMDNAAAGAMRLQVYPTPDSNRTVRVYTINPQEVLAADDLDTNIQVPTRPIEVGALWYALEERGEELGTKGLFTQEVFERTLGSAVARDAAEQGEYQLVPV